MMEPTGHSTVGFHPREIAKIFGVHLRTVFRWIGNGYISSSYGRVSSKEIEEILPIWKNSIPKAIARDLLEITQNTLRSWVSKGILEMVVVMGEERITMTSVTKAPKKRQTGAFLRQDYYTLYKTTQELGTTQKTLNKYLHQIPHEIVDRKKVVKKSEVEKLKEKIKTSLTTREASASLGVNRSAIDRCIDSGKVSHFSLLGVRRILKDDWDEYTKKRVAEKLQRVVRKERLKAEADARKKLAKASLLQKQKERQDRKVKALIRKTKLQEQRQKDKKAKALLEQAKKLGPTITKKTQVQKPIEKDKKDKTSSKSLVKRPLSNSAKPKFQIPNYEPKLIVKEILGRRCNVTTVYEASMAMGQGSLEVNRLMNIGTLRFFEEDGERFPYLASVRAWKERIKAQAQ